MATKIRALHQRKKGRDVFDLWLALTVMNLTGAQIIGAFGPYRPRGLTAGIAIAALDQKLADGGFRTDLNTLVITPPAGYDVLAAGAMVKAQILTKL